MKKVSQADRTIEVIALRNEFGTYDVVTSFLKNTVGDYLGKSEKLTKEEAEQLAKKWVAWQIQNRHLRDMTKVELDETELGFVESNQNPLVFDHYEVL